MTGFLLIFLTTAGTALTFASFPQTLKWIPIAISITATIFAAFQTFMKFSEQAETHRASARRYGKIKKEIEYLLDFQADSERLAEMVENIRRREVELSQDSPNTLAKDWRRAKKETLEENDKFSIRNRNN
jgi:hypothetical protein